MFGLVIIPHSDARQSEVLETQAQYQPREDEMCAIAPSNSQNVATSNNHFLNPTHLMQVTLSFPFIISTTFENREFLKSPKLPFLLPLFSLNWLKISGSYEILL